MVAAGLLVQGGVPRVARGEAGLARALASAQFDDGGLVSRSPFEQVLLVDRMGLLRACYQASKQTIPDGIEAAAAAGVTAIAQPGGSVRDDEVIAAADRLGLTMVFTSVRHFRH